MVKYLSDLANVNINQFKTKNRKKIIHNFIKYKLNKLIKMKKI